MFLSHPALPTERPAMTPGAWDYGFRDALYECRHHPQRRWYWWITMPLAGLLLLPQDILYGDWLRRRAMRKHGANGVLR